MFIGLLLCTAALAGEPGHYHPDQVGQHSKVFVEASAKVAERFGAVEAEMARVSPDLVQLDQAAILCSRRASQEFSSYAATVRRDGAHQTAVVQAFVDTLVEDFERTFGSAMERALPAATEGYEVSLCKGSGIHALMGRTQCEGTDLAPLIGKQMDLDELLAADVAEILGLEWPGFEVQGHTQAVVPITGVGGFVQFDLLVDILVAQRVKGIQARHAAALEEVAPDLEEGETRAQREQALQKAQDLREIYESELADLGEELFAAVEASLGRNARKGAPAAVGVCANPKNLGGCSGEDLTDIVMPLLEADKKLAKALAP